MTMMAVMTMTLNPSSTFWTSFWNIIVNIPCIRITFATMKRASHAFLFQILAPLFFPPSFLTLFLFKCYKTLSTSHSFRLHFSVFSFVCVCMCEWLHSSAFVLFCDCSCMKRCKKMLNLHESNLKSRLRSIIQAAAEWKNKTKTENKKCSSCIVSRSNVLAHVSDYARYTTQPFLFCSARKNVKKNGKNGSNRTR